MKTFAELLAEQTKALEITEADLDDLVENLTWADIADLYDDSDFVDDDEELDEAISAQSRLKKRMSMARHKAKRTTMRGIKLRRASDPKVLRKRATAAARRAMAAKLLIGRDRSKLSPAEKDMIEARLKSMKGLQNVLAMRMVPKIRKLEQGRLYSKAKRK